MVAHRQGYHSIAPADKQVNEMVPERGFAERSSRDLLFYTMIYQTRMLVHAVIH